jgi:hypothetical protein
MRFKHQITSSKHQTNPKLEIKMYETYVVDL